MHPAHIGLKSKAKYRIGKRYKLRLDYGRHLVGHGKARDESGQSTSSRIRSRTRSAIPEFESDDAECALLASGLLWQLRLYGEMESTSRSRSSDDDSARPDDWRLALRRPFGEAVQQHLPQKPGPAECGCFASCGSSPENWLADEPGFTPSVAIASTPDKLPVYRDFVKASHRARLAKVRALVRRYQPTVVLVRGTLDGSGSERRRSTRSCTASSRGSRQYCAADHLDRAARLVRLAQSRGVCSLIQPPRAALT